MIEIIEISVPGMQRVAANKQLCVNAMMQCEWERVKSKIPLLRKRNYLYEFEHNVKNDEESLVRNLRRSDPSLIMAQAEFEYITPEMRMLWIDGLSEARIRLIKESVTLNDSNDEA